MSVLPFWLILNQFEIFPYFSDLRWVRSKKKPSDIIFIEGDELPKDLASAILDIETQLSSIDRNLDRDRYLILKENLKVYRAALKDVDVPESYPQLSDPQKEAIRHLTDTYGIRSLVKVRNLYILFFISTYFKEITHIQRRNAFLSMIIVALLKRKKIRHGWDMSKERIVWSDIRLLISLLSIRGRYLFEPFYENLAVAEQEYERWKRKNRIIYRKLQLENKISSRHELQRLGLNQRITLTKQFSSKEKFHKAFKGLITTSETDDIRKLKQAFSNFQREKDSIVLEKKLKLVLAAAGKK